MDDSACAAHLWPRSLLWRPNAAQDSRAADAIFTTEKDAVRLEDLTQVVIKISVTGVLESRASLNPISSRYRS